MPKLKTKKTLKKRVRITKTGKILKGAISAGHLKVKWTANKKYRKKKPSMQKNKGHIKMFKRLLAKSGKNI